MKIKREISLNINHKNELKIALILEDLKKDIEQVFKDVDKNSCYSKWISVKTEVGK